jgi:Rrf2 family protein
VVKNGPVKISAKSDYAVRAMLALSGAVEDAPMKGEQIAEAQEIPLRFLENILRELGHNGLVNSRRGGDGGYWLGEPPDKITIAEIIRAVDGPLASVRGEPADELHYQGDAEPLQEVWIALRANIRDVLESVTVADVVAGELPEDVRAIARKPDVWEAR